MNNNNIQEGKNVTNSSSPRGGREGALITGAEALMRSLEHEGVETLFGYPGGAIMPTFDALYDHKETLNHILVRHEQAPGLGHLERMIDEGIAVAVIDLPVVDIHRVAEEIVVVAGVHLRVVAVLRVVVKDAVGVLDFVDDRALVV